MEVLIFLIFLSLLCTAFSIWFVKNTPARTIRREELQRKSDIDVEQYRIEQEELRRRTAEAEAREKADQAKVRQNIRDTAEMQRQQEIEERRLSLQEKELHQQEQQVKLAREALEIEERKQKRREEIKEQQENERKMAEKREAERQRDKESAWIQHMTLRYDQPEYAKRDHQDEVIRYARQYREEIVSNAEGIQREYELFHRTAMAAWGDIDSTPKELFAAQGKTSVELNSEAVERLKSKRPDIYNRTDEVFNMRCLLAAQQLEPEKETTLELEVTEQKPDRADDVNEAERFAVKERAKQDMIFTQLELEDDFRATMQKKFSHRDDQEIKEILRDYTDDMNLKRKRGSPGADHPTRDIERY